MTDTNNKAAYDERLKRLEDNVALKETDRVPFIYFSTFWAARLQGLTFAQMMYDVDKYIGVSKQAIAMLQPDAFSSLLFAFGPTLEGLDYRPMKWPGGGEVGDMATFQYLDQEFMTAGRVRRLHLRPHRLLPAQVPSAPGRSLRAAWHSFLTLRRSQSGI